MTVALLKPSVILAYPDQKLDNVPVRANGATIYNGVIYPESDGLPMAESTVQFDYLVGIKNGYEGYYKDDPNVFIAGDLLWYPVEGDSKICAAPDVMLVYGRPKGDRGSYLQFLEKNIAPQITFEILSPTNTQGEMERKRTFFERFGVEEYYQYDPQKSELLGWIRRGNQFRQIATMSGWVSPRSKIRFELEQGKLVLYQPDGTKFESYVKLLEQAEIERQRSEQERQRAEQEHKRAEQEHKRAERLAARLRELGIDPE